ncbi:MAG: hypothetical protein U1F66_01610 [bacterium]
MKRHPHETTVCALFKNPVAAQNAINALAPMSLAKEDISLILSEEAYQKEELVQTVLGEYLHQESVHAGKVGGIAGALVAGLTAVAAMVSGGASLLAAGPIVAILATAGGMVGGLLGAGFTEEEAKVIDEGIRLGDVLVVVHAESKEIGRRAEEIFQAQHAERVRHHQ